MKRYVPFLLPALTLLFAAVFLFHRLGVHPLGKFDEARRAVNAFEMASGQAHPLVPTYAGLPDHWGTKPPLLVWLQSGSMELFGPTAFAVRFPSAIAGLLLVALLLYWGRRDWGTYLVGALAAVYVLGNAEFMSSHGLRTGDFDALLTLFLTAQLCFLASYAERRDRRSLLLFGGALLLAGWTKGIAGCLFLPGVGLWLLGPSRIRLLARPAPYIVGFVALLLIAIYYPVREMVDPGYLDLVWNNELGGRFGRSNEGHTGPWYFYLDALFFDEGALYLNLLLIPALLPLLHKPSAATRLIALTAVAYLVIISVSATKIFWYKSPLLPLLGLLLGAGAERWWRDYRAGERRRAESLGFAVLLVVATLLALRVTWRQAHLHLPLRNFTAAVPTHYPAFTDPAFAGDRTLLLGDYQPEARFYAYAASAGGDSVGLAYTVLPPAGVGNLERSDIRFRVGEKVAVCTTPDWNFLHARVEVRTLAQAENCRLFEVTALRPESATQE